MRIERTRNTVRGTFYGILYKCIQIIFPFIIRTIFIHTLGAEYLGLNSLFTAILQVLNLAELGVSSALVFSMYRPIVDDNREKICQLLNLYREYYRIIGMVILIIGLLLIPLLPLLIKDEIPAGVNIYVLYIMNLSTTVLSYWLYAYRTSILVAHQRNDVISIISISISICMYSIQAIMLLLFKNYYIYLTINIIGQISINVFSALISKMYYPDYTPKGKLPKDERKEIGKKIRDLFTSKIGAVINHSADTIIISMLIGLEVLTVYQNYYYIISSIMALFTIFFNACTAGIGNSLIVNDKKQNRVLLYNINHIVFMTITFCCACFVSTCQPFMKLWMGEKYELEFSFVILFAIYLIAEEAPRTLVVFKDAGGIWRHDRYRPLVTACVNLCLNIVLTKFIGLHGIIISTIVALLFVAYPWLICNINKRLFPIDIKKYICRLLLYIMVIGLSCYLAYLFSELFVLDSLVLSIILRLIISGAVSILLFLVIFFRTDETKYLFGLLKSIKKKSNK